MYPRHSQHRVLEAMQDTPVVIISGPRQCGKTTLVKHLPLEDCQYVTLDNPVYYQAAQDDPIGFIRGLDARHVLIDEIQRVPELFLPIKQSVDEDRLPGRYLLTGSANVFMLPALADSLAGRMEVVPLQPLASCEIQAVPSTFLQKVLLGVPPKSKTKRIKEVLIEKMLAGGFPEPLRRSQEHRRMAWHDQYIQGIVHKDIKDIEGLVNSDAAMRLIHLLSHQVGQLTNVTALAAKIGVARQTVMRHLSVLKQLYLFESLPAWHRNSIRRLIKAPKMQMVDSGLMAAMQSLNHAKLAQDPSLLGPLLENYVYAELKRLASWHDQRLFFYHYRDKDKVEVDVVIETVSGGVIGIEVKASATVKPSDFKGLTRLKEIAGDQFIMGMVLYDGDDTIQHANQLYSAPLGILWV